MYLGFFDYVSNKFASVGGFTPPEPFTITHSHMFPNYCSNFRGKLDQIRKDLRKWQNFHSNFQNGKFSQCPFACFL